MAISKGYKLGKQSSICLQTYFAIEAGALVLWLWEMTHFQEAVGSNSCALDTRWTLFLMTLL